jgi:hypothetical protein
MRTHRCLLTCVYLFVFLTSFGGEKIEKEVRKTNKHTHFTNKKITLMRCAGLLTFAAAAVAVLLLAAAAPVRDLAFPAAFAPEMGQGEMASAFIATCRPPLPRPSWDSPRPRSAGRRYRELPPPRGCLGVPPLGRRRLGVVVSSVLGAPTSSPRGN